MPLEGERARRIIVAVLQNVDNWRSRIEEIESFATPGNKVRALSLLRDIEMFKLSLCRLAKLEGAAICEPATKPEGLSAEPAADKPPDT